MIVFDLACAHGHLFEGWFACADDFERQCADQQVRCPVCDSPNVERRLSAPRLNLGASAPASETTADAVSPDPSRALQAAWLQWVKRTLEATEDVGERFTQEARRIHAEEAPARPIRGTASIDEVRALGEEGIEVFALPVPAALKGPVQ